MNGKFLVFFHTYTLRMDLMDEILPSIFIFRRLVFQPTQKITWVMDLMKKKNCIY
jgi:hypothetical protein